MNIKRITIVLSSVLSLGALSMISSDALAGTATANLEVSASVAANCTIGTTALAFGAYDAVTANASTALTNTGTVSVTCTNGSPVTITLGQGVSPFTGSTDIVPLRQMVHGTDAANFLKYHLYQAEGTTVWGNTSGTGVAFSGIGTNQSTTIYGSVTEGQTTAKVGSYTDTVVATVTF